MFELRGFIIGLCIVGLILCGYFISYVFDELPSYGFNSVLAQAIDCVEDGDIKECSAPIAEKLLNLRSGHEVMDVLSQNLSPLHCHSMAHSIGREIFHRYQDIGIAMLACNRACDSGCVHGVIGELFFTQLGYDDPDFDLKHLSSEDIRRLGSRLCIVSQACHGVGHALFQTYGEFGLSLAMCREVAPVSMVHHCYHGVFMEYADVLDSKSLRSAHGIEYPSIEELESFCDFPSAQEQRACARYHARIVVATLERNGYSTQDARARFLETCESATQKDDRVACMYSIGAYTSSLIMTAVGDAVFVCQQFPELEDQMACVLGQISVSTQERQSNIFTYCMALPNVALQTFCYQSVFYFMNQGGASIDDTKHFCKDNQMCLQGATGFELDPWERLRHW